MAVLIAPSTTQVDSAIFSVTPDVPASIAMMPPTGGDLPANCIAEIRRVTGADSILIGVLRDFPIAERSVVIHGAGDWIIRRLAGPKFGIDKV